MKRHEIPCKSIPRKVEIAVNSLESEDEGLERIRSFGGRTGPGSSGIAAVRKSGREMETF